MNRPEIEKRCIFYDNHNCYLLASKPSECRLCYNFASTVPPDSNTPDGEIHVLDEYLTKFTDKYIIYPTGNKVQGRLQF